MNVICDYVDLQAVDILQKVILMNGLIILCGIAVFIYLIIAAIFSNNGNDVCIELFPLISTIVAVLVTVFAISGAKFCVDYIADTSHITVVEFPENADMSVLENFYKQYKGEIVGELPGNQYIIKVPYTSE